MATKGCMLEAESLNRSFGLCSMFTESLEPEGPWLNYLALSHLIQIDTDILFRDMDDNPIRKEYVSTDSQERWAYFFFFLMKRLSPQGLCTCCSLPGMLFPHISWCPASGHTVLFFFNVKNAHPSLTLTISWPWFTFSIPLTTVKTHCIPIWFLTSLLEWKPHKTREWFCPLLYTHWGK